MLEKLLVWFAIATRSKTVVVFFLKLQFSFFRLKNSQLPVTVNKTIGCCLGGKRREITAQASSEVQSAIFKKNGNNIDYVIPTSFSILENGNNRLKN